MYLIYFTSVPQVTHYKLHKMLLDIQWNEKDPYSTLDIFELNTAEQGSLLQAFLGPLK